MGVSASVSSQTVAVGNAEFMSRFGADTASVEKWADDHRNTGATVMFAAVDGKLSGAFALADTLRSEGVFAVKTLRDMGIKTIMLTGDSEATARAIAAQAGVDEVRAGLLPADKEAAVSALQHTGRVMMVGDGINDAPALTRADLGVAVAKGADVAIESADCVLVRDDPALSAGAVSLGRATMRNIKQNLFWACIYNGLMIPVAAGALSSLGLTMNPMLAAAAMSVSSLCVVTNALRLRKFRFDHPQPAPKSAAENICPIEIIEGGSPAMKKTVKIEGMMCMHCVAHVKKALEALGLKAEVELAAKRAVVEGEATDEAIRAAITDAGYEVTGIE